MTDLYALFGHPVGHSLSAVMQNAAFAARGLDAVYLAFDIEEPGLAAAVSSLRALGIRGANVTIPHKRAVAPYLDELCGEAALTGSVNTIVNERRRLFGHSTDGEGFVRSLRSAGITGLAGLEICLLGTGGAALAVAARLLREGAARLTVVTRDARRRLDWPSGITVHRLLTYDELAAAPEAIAGCRLLINTTPLGMSPREDAMPPVPETVFRPGTIVYDLIYHPPRTRLMKTAERRGTTAIGGLDMLVYQGAASFELWTGLPAPVEQMKTAVEKSLDSYGQ